MNASIIDVIEIVMTDYGYFEIEKVQKYQDEVPVTIDIQMSKNDQNMFLINNTALYNEQDKWYWCEMIFFNGSSFATILNWF